MKLELTKNELDYIQNSLNQYGQTLFNETIEKHRNGEETSSELIAHTSEGNILHTKIINLMKGAN